MKISYFKVLGSLVGMAMLLCTTSANAQGLVLNEFSNGPSGTQEYFEFVVVGPTLNPNCGPIDIRGWIFDDNNGDFSCGACAGTGIAAGHFRFAALAVWSAVPTGSIIVVYDPAFKNAKIPADDPNDTSPADGVYILPTNHASIEGSTTPCVSGNMPTGSGACGSCAGNIGYAGACYVAAPTSTNAGLRNTGDAAQTRYPNGTYFHGIGYGNGASLINGGPDGLFISGDGTGLCYAFNNSANDNFRAVANFNSATVASNAETPGLANTVNNQTWINSLKAPCILPVSYYQPLQGQAMGTVNRLSWITGSETNGGHFEVQRSHDLTHGFEAIGQVQAVGNSRNLVPYSFEDAAPGNAVNWYRLVHVDQNGQIQTSEVVEVLNPGLGAPVIVLWPQPAQDRLHVQVSGMDVQSLQCMDLLGRVVGNFDVATANSSSEFEIDLSSLPQGNYLLRFQTSKGVTTRSLSVSKE